MPVLRCEIFRLLANACPSVIDEDIETAKSLDSMLDCLMTGRFLQNIQIHKLSLGVKRTQFR